MTRIMNRHDALHALCLLLLTVLSIRNLSAQRFSEWFKQKKTQKKYLLAQIAALETYVQAVEKGYHIANDGLATIAALKDGDLRQHTVYFASLTMVSPRVKNYSKVLAITELADQSEKLRRKMMDIKDLNVLLSIKEIAELRRINEEASSEAVKDLDELELLVTDGGLKMTDDQRIRRIDQLYSEVKHKLSGTLLLARRMQTLVSGRKKQATDRQILKQLYGK